MALLEFKEKYIVQSSVQAVTIGPGLDHEPEFADDPQAIKNFTIVSDLPLTALVIYSEHMASEPYTTQYGKYAAINVDGVDYSIVEDSACVDNLTGACPQRNTTFWVGTLQPGSHTIKGRFAALEASTRAVIDNRTLAIYLFYGNEFSFVTSAAQQVLTTNSLVDDASASITRTPSGACKGLYLYAASNLGFMQAEHPGGKKVAINVAGVDYSQAEKSPAATTFPDSIFTVYASALAPVPVTVKGRAASNKASTSTTISSRHLAVLFFKTGSHLFSIDKNTAHLKEWTGSIWVDHAGLCLEVAGNSSTEVNVIGTDYNIWIWNGAAFSQFTTSADVKKISITPSGRLFVIDKNTNNLKEWSGSAWLNRGGGCLEVSALSVTEVYVVGTDYNIWLWNGSAFSQLTTSASVQKVSVGNDGRRFYIDKTTHNLMEWNGSTWLNRGGGCLDLRAVSVSEVYVVGTDYNTYLWNGSGFSLLTTSGDLLKISIHNDTLLDVVNNTTSTSTTSNALVDDPNASISRSTSANRELLVIGMATHRDSIAGVDTGERYGIKVDANDRQQSRGAPYNATYADSVGVVWGETLAAGAHTVKGRISNNYSTNNAVISARVIVSLWLVPAKTKRVISIGTGAYHLTGKSVKLKRGRKIRPLSGAFHLTGKSVTLTLYHDRVLVGSTGHFHLTGTPSTRLKHRAIIHPSAGALSLTGRNLNLTKGPVEPRILFDASAQSSWIRDTLNGSGTETFSFYHTQGLGHNRILLVAVSCFSINDRPYPTCLSVTYNGAPLSKVISRARETFYNHENAEISIWALPAPDVGYHLVEVTINGACDNAAAISSSYLGAKQTTGLIYDSAFHWDDNEDIGLTLIPIQDKSWIFASMAVLSMYGTTGVTPDQNDRGHSTDNLSTSWYGMMAEDTGALTPLIPDTVSCWAHLFSVGVIAAVVLEPALLDAYILPQPKGVYFDATASFPWIDTPAGGGIYTFSYNHIVGPGLRGMLIVGCTVVGSSSEGIPEAQVEFVRYYGIDLVKVSEAITWNGENYIHTTFWMLHSPPLGSHSIVVTYYLFGSPSVKICSASASYIGVFHLEQPDAQGAGHESATLITRSVGCWIFAMGCIVNNAASTLEPKQTGRATLSTSNNTIKMIAEDTNGPVMNDVANTMGVLPGPYTQCLTAAIAFGTGGSIAILPGEFHVEGKNVMLKYSQWGDYDHPRLAPTIEDGLYIIRRRALGAGVKKTLLCHPYNDKVFDFRIAPASGERSNFGQWGAGSWGDYSAWRHYHFVRNDPDMMLVAFWSTGQDIFYVSPDRDNWPLVPPDDLITKVTVKAYVKGRCKTILGITANWNWQNPILYKGDLSRDKGTFVWVETDYPLNPRSGAAWDWATIFNKLIAGIELRSPISTLVPYDTWTELNNPDIYPWDYNDWPPKGTEEAPLPNGCPIPYDPRIERIEDSGKCVYLKVTASYAGLWGGQYYAGEIDLWPISDYYVEFCVDSTLGAAPRLMPSLGNVLRGGKILNYLPPTDNSNMHFWSRGNVNPGFIGSGVWNLPATLSFTGIKVSVPILLIGYNHGWISCNLYIKFDGVTYQLAGPQSQSTSTTATATWSTNPKTGGAWAVADLRKITEVGVIFTAMGLASDALLGVSMPYAELNQTPPATRGGSYKRIEVGDDSQIYLIGTDNKLHRWDLSNQFTLCQDPLELIRLAVICKWADTSGDPYPEKTIFVLASDGTIRWGYGSGSTIAFQPWGGGTFLDIAACRGADNPGGPGFQSNILYLVQTNYTILRDDGYSSVAYAAGANTEKIAVTPDGHLFCIDRTSTNLKEWNGSTWLNHGGLCLELTANSVTEVYVIGTNHNIYLWNGTAFSQFTTSGDVLDLAIHPHGHLFYLTTANVLMDWTTTAFAYRNGPVVLPVNKWTPSFGKSYAGCTADDALGYYVGPDINVNHPRFTSNQFHGSLMDHGNKTARYESDLSEIPPENSLPISIEVYLSFNGFAEDQVNSKIRMYVYTNGRRYYSNVILFNNYLYLINDFTYKWSLNPATGAAWTYDDFQGLTFGVEVTRANSDYNVYFNLYRLDAEIQYYEGQGYTCSLAPVDPLRILEFTRYAQNPIKADDLVFSLPANAILEELTPLALYRGGKPIWQGLVWTRDELLNSVEVIHRAKSQQIMLYFKYLPSFSTYPRNSYYDTVYSLADLFSDDIPEYPAYQHLAEFTCPGEYYNCYWEDLEQWQKDFNRDYPPPVWSVPLNPGARALANLGIQTVQAHDSKIGIFFLLNGIIPVSRAVNTLKGFASQIRGKPKFLLSHVSMMGPHNDLSEAWTYSFDIHTSPSWPYPLAGVGGAWSHAVYIPSQISGFTNGCGIKVYPDVNYLRRLKPGDPVANFDEYSISGEDVSLHPWAAGSIVAVYHALDTWLRPGVFDSGSKYLSVPWLFGMGSFAASFNALFPAIAKEIEFVPSPDCLVYMNVKDRVGSGSETEPVRVYVHGQEDTWISQEHVIFPHYDIAIGDCITPQAAANWPTHGPVIEKVVTNYANDLSILRKYLAASLDDEVISFVINKLGEDWDLCQGDTISVQPRTGAAQICRVSRVSTLPGRTLIYAGKRIITLEEMFQGWSNIEAGGQLDHVLQSDDISIDGPTGTKTFVIKAENVDETWRCKIDFSWTLWTDSSYTTPVTPPANLFVTFALNGKVIPPGRIRQLDNSGSISIDLTDYVSTSTTANMTNTLVMKLWNGIAKQANFYHKISGTVTQISTAELLETQ